MPIPEMEWNLEDYTHTFWIHRWLILFTTVAFGVFMAIHMAQKPNIYQATARILIESQSAQLVKFQEITPYTGWNPTFLQTEYQIITSSEVLEKVAEELNLASFPPFSRTDDPVSMLKNMVAVNPIRGTKLVDVTATSTKAHLADKVANAVADVYTRLNLERRQQMTTGGIQWLKEEVIRAEEKTTAAQIALQQFNEQHQSLPVGKEEQATVLQGLSQLNAAITEAKKQRIEAETRYRQKHPILLEIQAKERDLETALKQQEQLVMEMNRLSIEYNNLQRDAQASESIYSVLLTRLKELSVQEGIQANNVKVVGAAKTPKDPIGPDRQRTVASAMAVGLLVGLGLSILLEILAKTIRTRREFEQVLEIPFLGQIPAIQLTKQHRGNESLLLLMEPQSTAAESIRALRTTLEFLLPAGQPHVLLITSALPQEGKSLVSLNLTIALQELGRKVILIDADMRRPTVHRLFNLPLEPGLSGYLQGQAGIEELAQTTPLAPDLSIIPAGMTPDQPADLLASPKMRELVEKLKTDYQYVLLDTPPVLAVADTTALTSLVEGVIYVTWGGRTHRDVSLSGKARLVDVGAKILGGVLNGVRLEGRRGYRYNYYYYSGKKSKKGKNSKPTREPAPESSAGSSEEES